MHLYCFLVLAARVLFGVQRFWFLVPCLGFLVSCSLCVLARRLLLVCILGGLLFLVPCVFFLVYCLLFVLCCLLVCCFLFGVSVLLFVVCRVVCCVLAAVRCLFLLFVASCLSRCLLCVV